MHEIRPTHGRAKSSVGASTRGSKKDERYALISVSSVEDTAEIVLKVEEVMTLEIIPQLEKGCRSHLEQWIIELLRFPRLLWAIGPTLKNATTGEAALTMAKRVTM